MFDGRFDQHFLEIFAEAQTRTKGGDTAPWVSLVTVLVAAAALGAGAFLLA